MKDFYKCIPIDTMCAALRFLSNNEIVDILRKLFDESYADISLSDNAEYLFKIFSDFSTEQHKKRERQTRGLKQYQNREPMLPPSNEKNNSPSSEDEIGKILGESKYD